MADYQELIRKATHRLSRDRELRLEVSRELESHLEASAAEFRQGGYDPEGAVAAAKKAFGDPDDVANELWNANRFRLKLRAWAWWAARATLWPACVLALLVFVVSMRDTVWIAGDPIGSAGREVIRRAESRQKTGMSESQRLIFFGDESADNHVDRWRAVRDAYPHEVFHQIHLISLMLSELSQDNGLLQEPAPWLEIHEELERAHTLDPANGVYALIRAGLNARKISLDDREHRVDPAVVMTLDLTNDARREAWTLEPDVADALERSGHRAKRVATEIRRLPVQADRQAVAGLIDALSQPAQRPYLTLYVSDRIRYRMDQLPPASSMQDYLVRIDDAIGMFLSELSFVRQAARVACAEALRLAEAGDADAAVAVLDDLAAVNARMAASSDTLIELLVVVACEKLQRAARVAVWQTLDEPARAAEALAHSDEIILFFEREWGGPLRRGETGGDLEKRGGVLVSLLMPAAPGYEIDPAPYRQAEYTLVDQAAVTCGMAVLVVLAAGLALAGGLAARRDRAEAAVLMWIGWKRLAWVLGGAIGLPVLAYIAWSASPWSGRGYGLNHRPVGAVVSYAPLFLAVAALLVGLGLLALRARGRELGLSVPAGRWRWIPSTLLSAVGYRGPHEQWLFRGSAIRSLSPLCTAACLLLVLVGWGLDRREAYLVRGVAEESPYFFGNEVERTRGARTIVDYLAGDLERPPRR